MCAVAVGSGPPVTTAVFVGVTVASCTSVPVSVYDAVCPTSSSIAGHTAVPFVTGQTLPSAAVMLAALTPSGTRSVTTTSRARDGPLFVTDTRHSICCPGTTGSVSSTFETTRLACGEGELVGEATAVCAVALGSGPPVTTAVFVGVTVAFGSSVPDSVQVRVSPAGISTAGQVAVPPLIGQAVPSCGVIDGLDTPDGT
ncbi:hypothetical protein VM98_27785 [Streptomyces rubellomurinus subsp. indigoferus]|nr:hypothetical protein VM98_27785 [Streptomyces rubellomurinus subsp. indigoferus]